MKLLLLPVMALGLAAFALPAAAQNCPYPKSQTTEKPAEKPKDQTS